MDPALLSRHNVRQSGGGTTTLLFVHGLGTSQRIWAPLLPLLAPDHQVVTLDLAGCGDAQASGDLPAYDTLDGHADDLLAIATQLRQHGRTTLIVHSIGAMIGLIAERKAPHLFDAHVMVCPAPCYQKLPDFPGAFELVDIEQMLQAIAADRTGWARAMAPAVTGTPEASAECKFFIEEIGRADARSLDRFARAALLCDFRAQLSGLVKPTLVLQTRADPIVPAAVGDYMKGRLPDGELVTLDLAGHFPHRLDPQACAAPILRMLRHVMPG